MIPGASQQCSGLSWQIPLSTSTGGFGIFPLRIPIGRAGSHSLSKLLGSAGGFGVEKKNSETKLLVGVIQFHSFSCMDSHGQRFQGKQGCLGTNEWPSHTLDVELCTRDWWVTSGTGTRGCCHSLWIQGISSCVWPDNSHGQEGRGRSWMGGIDGGRF